MKKKLLLLLTLVMVLLPFNAKAVEGYNSKNLKETFEAENIDANLKNYKESDKQITIYMFRGQDCSHCQEFLGFLSSIVKDYGKYFKLESFEVWNDSNNGTLMTMVSSILGEKASGVPYIIIGDKTFSGYTSEYDADMKKAINDLYKSEEKYDVMEHLSEYKADAPVEEKKVDNVSNGNAAVWIFVAVILVVVAVTKVVKNKKSEKPTPVVKVNEIKPKEEVKEEVKVVKEHSEKKNTKPHNNKNTKKKPNKNYTPNKSKK